MARQLRMEYEGAIYHLMSRGDRREPIFTDDQDRESFLATLGVACERAGWEVHAYCLMGNHFHLVLETPRPTLVAGMKWMLGTYTQRFNSRHRLRGHLFSGRYKSLIVDESDSFYLRVVCDYVHLNPSRAHLLGENGRLEEYLWSSFPMYLKPPTKRESWLRVDRLLGEHGIQRDDSRGRRTFGQRMEERTREENVEEERLWKDIRRGWRFGNDDFLERLGNLVEKTGARDSHRAEELNETMETTAHRMIKEFCHKEGLELSELRAMPKGSRLKTILTMRLREKTTQPMKWIAKELNAGAPATLWKGIWKLKQEKGNKTRD